MTTLIAENNFQTVTTNVINASDTDEIRIGLNQAPISSIGVLTLGTETATPEDIFFHRKDGLNVYTYAVNRKTPQNHSVQTSVQMNDSAELFNFLSANIYTTFYTYKISLTEVFVMGGKIYKDGAIIDIPSAILPIAGLYNYIYVTDLNTISVKNEPSGFVVGLVTKSGPIVTIEKYNVIGFGAKGEKGEDGSIASAPPNTTQTVVDNVVPPAGSTFTYMDAELWTKITYPDGSYLLNLATGNTHSFGLPAGKYLYSSTNEQWSSDPIAGTYDAGTHTITWSNGSTTTGTTGVTTVPDGNIAYQNEANTFEKNNTFEGDVAFLGRTTFPYYDMGSQAGNVTFNQKLGMQQKVTFTGASAHVITFNNLVQSCGVLAVVQSGSGTVTFAIGTGNGTVVDKYVIAGSFTAPVALAAGTHFFSLNVFSTAIHIMYVGSSVSF